MKSFFLIALGVFLFQAAAPLASATAENIPVSIKVGYFSHESSSHISPENKDYGYSYDFLQEIAQYNNWELEFIPGSERETLERIRNGNIDIISHSHYREDLKDLLDHSTRESGSCRVGLYSLKTDERLAQNDLEAFSEKSIGIFAPLRHRQILERSLSNSRIRVDLIDFDTAEGLIVALKKGSVAGALISGNNVPTDLKIIKVFPEEPFYFAVAEGNRDLLLKIDSAMQDILLMNPSFRNDLFKKHYGKNLSWESVLTSKEKEYIDKSPVLVVSYDPQWQPFEYYDKEKKEMSGINSEILKLVKEYTGLKIEISHSPTWTVALRRMREGEIDILTGVNRSFVWGAKNNFRVTRPFLTAPIVMVMKRANTYAGERVALPKDYFLSEVVESFQKFDDTVYLKSQEDCFDALVHNKIHATFANSYVANYLISLPHYSNLYTT